MPSSDTAVPPPDELLNLAGRRAVVTGAAGGIGAGIARRFAAAGAAVAVNYRSNEHGAQAVVAAIRADGGTASAVRADVSRREGAEGALAGAVEALGGLDVLVNNAGIYPLAALLDMDEHEFDAVLASNLRSTHLCTQAAAQWMIDAGVRGAIVNIASIEAENPAPLHGHYAAAKAGVVMHTRAAAAELGAHGIRVNSVCPGLIRREGIDETWPDGVERYRRAAALGRLGEPEDVADACLFLASPAARWVTGANLVVDGGVLTHTVY